MLNLARNNFINKCEKVTQEKRKHGNKKEHKGNKSTIKIKKDDKKKKKKLIKDIVQKKQVPKKKTVKRKKYKKKRKKKHKKQKKANRKNVSVANLKPNEIASLIIKRRREYMRNILKKKNKKN